MPRLLGESWDPTEFSTMFLVGAPRSVVNVVTGNVPRLFHGGGTIPWDSEKKLLVLCIPGIRI
jgi:hypothetical protein